MSFDPYPDRLDGVPLARWGDHELRRVIDRAMEQETDAMRYGGPAYAQMYRERRQKAERELGRRR